MANENVDARRPVYDNIKLYATEKKCFPAGRSKMQKKK